MYKTILTHQSSLTEVQQEKKMKFWSFSFLLALLGVTVQALTLEDVTDAELTKLIKQEQYVLVLFSKHHIFQSLIN